MTTVSTPSSLSSAGSWSTCGRIEVAAELRGTGPEQALARDGEALRLREESVQAQLGELDDGLARLAAGGDATHPTHPQRPGAGRPGAPLWRVVDFAPGLEDTERAGLEGPSRPPARWTRGSSPTVTCAAPTGICCCLCWVSFGKLRSADGRFRVGAPTGVGSRARGLVVGGAAPGGTGEAWRRLVWAGVGLLRDDPSSTVLSFGVPCSSGTATGRAFEALG